MGWSYRVEAGRTMDRWSAACVRSTGSSNEWTEKRGTFFWETSRTEHADGAITGRVFKVLVAAVGNESGRARRAGTFRIEPDGTVGRAPAFLKAAARVPRNPGDFSRTGRPEVIYA